MLDEYVSENMTQLEFLDRIKLRGTGLVGGDSSTYEVGANYNLSQNWALDYEYEQLGSIQNVRVTGNYLLDNILRWMNNKRMTYFGYDASEEEKKKKKKEAETKYDRLW